MERKVRSFVLASLLVLGTGVAAAQPIVIRSSDMQDVFAVGRRLVYHYDTQTANASIGSTNGPNTWDFSGLRSTKVEVRTSVALNASKYAAEFPGATHAMLDTAFAYRIDTGTMGLGMGTLKSPEAFFFYSVGTDMKYYGVGAIATGYLDAMGEGFPITVTNPRWKNTPPAVQYQFPIELAKTWETNFADTLFGVIEFLGTYNLALPNTDAVVYTVDAYGTLSVPGGYSQPALRIRKLGKYSFVDTLNYLNNPLQYIFLAKNGAMVEVGPVDSTVTEGTVKIRYAKWTIPVPTDVKEVADVPVSFGLDQNYPNPFNPTTVVSYQLPVASSVRLVVFDLLGREVATLVNEAQQAGEHSVRFNAANLTSGVYFYTLTAGNYTATKRLMLLK